MLSIIPKTNGDRMRSMKNGDFIVDRWMPDMIREIGMQYGLTVTSLSDDWLLEVSSQHVRRRILGYRFDVNDSVAAGISVDKVAAYQVMRVSNVTAVPHVLVRTNGGEAYGVQLFPWEDVVIKPLVGKGGYGVRRCTSQTDANEWMINNDIQAWAVSPFIDIQSETRLVLLDDQVLISYRKQPHVHDNLKMFNLSHGAIPNDTTPSAAFIELAQRARLVMGLRLAAVDIIEDVNGKPYVLEVNDSITLERYMRASPVHKRRGFEVYENIIKSITLTN